MTTLRLHRELYSLSAIECAREAFGTLCENHLVTEQTHYVVAVTTRDPGDAPQLAAELANYALAATIEERRH